MEIVLMGTASAGSGAGRDNTYLLVREENEAAMIDVGGNPLGKLRQLGIPLALVKRAVITHFHVDHVYGLPSLLWGMWLSGRTEPFEIYCSRTGVHWLQQWLDLLQMDQWPVQFEIRFHPFDWQKPSLIWRNGDASFSVFPSRHGVPAVGVKIEYRDRIIVYSSDTELNPEIKKIDQVHLLIHEATTARNALPAHSSLKGILHYYDLATIDKLVLVHWTDNEPYEEVLNSLEPPIRLKPKLGYDLDRYAL